METSGNKRARLRHELQQAYGAWMEASESSASFRGAGAAIDVSGCADSVKARWFDYLEAKKRLVLAFAERPLAA